MPAVSGGLSLDIDLARDRGSVLGKALSIKILGYLVSNPYTIASEVADRFGIHIATASKYLSEMEKAKLVASRIRQTGRKPAKEYYLLSDKIKFEIDLSEIPQSDAASRLEKQEVREQGGQNVAYDWDPDRPVIQEILLIRDEDGRKRAKKMTLDEVEGRFLWGLPFPGEEHRNAAQIARAAGILDPEDLEKVERLLDRLVELRIVERKVAQ